MAFIATNRVRVTDQHSEFRGKLGTVELVDDDGNHVRIDGHPVGKTQLFTDAQLVTTNFTSPVTYP